MATGFPTKANWVSGDILTAAAQDDLAGTVNLLSNAAATSGSVLVSNVAGTSFAYQPLQAAGKNAIINGGMDIWQRGTTATTGTITAATSGATTAYVVTNTFVVGQYVTVTGMTPTTLNGAGVVTVASGTGFTISATTSGVFSAGGTATGSPYIALAASSSNIYTSDRWTTTTVTNQAVTVSRQPTSDTTNLPNIQYCLRYQRNSGQTGTGQLYIAQSLETANSIPFAGKQVTFSFYARAGANYSAASNALVVNIWSGTGTDQNRLVVAYTGDTTIVSSPVTLTTTWQRFTVTGTVSSSATELATAFSYIPVGTAGANDYYEVTGVQLEMGSVATNFSRAGENIQWELAACQRYCYQVAGTGSSFSIIGTGFTASTTSGITYSFLPVTMRTQPTISYNNIRFVTSASTVTNFSTTGVTVTTGSTPTTINLAASLTAATANLPAFLDVTNATTSYFQFSAEL